MSYQSSMHDSQKDGKNFSARTKPMHVHWKQSSYSLQRQQKQ